MSKGIDRRRFMQLAGLSGAAALAGCRESGGGGGEAARTIKLGYVTPKTGSLAGFGEADDYVLGSMRRSSGAACRSAALPTRSRSCPRTPSPTPTAPPPSPAT